MKSVTPRGIVVRSAVTNVTDMMDVNISSVFWRGVKRRGLVMITRK
ncbi:MAG TPA: hypothetical protein PKH17_03755 [Candidatus Syntrophosphaera sp.]|nr:hypothetical protein [Candidatus Syntrophosphaera sp.]